MSEKRSFSTQSAWVVVVGAALAVSWWSLYSLAHSRFGMPFVLAAVVSTVFDGGALVLADLTQRYARTTDSGAAPRLLMLALIATSVWLNYQHAVMLGYSRPGEVLFSAPPAVAGLLFEVEQRYLHREALRAYGRVAPALPAFGRWAWLMHPIRTIRRVWRITASRIDSVPINLLDMNSPTIKNPTETETNQIAELTEDSDSQFIEENEENEFLKIIPNDLSGIDDLVVLDKAEPPRWDSLSKAEAVRRFETLIPGRTPGQVAELLSAKGVAIDAAYVRKVRQRANGVTSPAHAKTDVPAQRTEAGTR